MPYKDPVKAKEYQKEYQKKYYEEKREEILESKKKYREENREEIKKYREENKEYFQEKNKKYYEENREELLETNKKYKQDNKEKINEHNKERYHTDPCYKLRRIVKDSITAALKGGKGGESFLPYVDWTIPEFKEHLESQFEDWMTWDNHGVCHPTEKRWHIDHIKPQSVMLEGVTSMDDPKFRECWALENLRPLEARENMLKGNKIL